MSKLQNYNITTFKKLKLNYWGIRKGGCTTIKYILLCEDNPTIINNNIKKTKIKPKNTFGNLYYGWVHQACDYITPKQAMHNGCKNFIVLRDPIQRALSMYSNLVLRPERIINSGSIQFKKEAQHLIKNLSFEGFLDLLDKFPDRERNKHYRSQKSYCLIDDIIKLNLDNLENTIQTIHPSLHIDVRLNASTKHDIPSNEIVHRIQQTFADDIKLFKDCI